MFERGERGDAGCGGRARVQEQFFELLVRAERLRPRDCAEREALIPVSHEGLEPAHGSIGPPAGERYEPAETDVPVASPVDETLEDLYCVVTEPQRSLQSNAFVRVTQGTRDALPVPAGPNLRWPW